MGAPHDSPKSGHDIDDARRQSAIRKMIREFESGERCLLCRFQNAGASRRNRRRQLPRRHQQRIIPRDNLSRHADRLFQRERHRIVRNGIHLAGDFRGEAAVILEARRNVGEIVFGFDDRLARVAAFEFGQSAEGFDELCRPCGTARVRAPARSYSPTDLLQMRLWPPPRRGSRRRHWHPGPARSLLRSKDRRREKSSRTCWRPIRR